MDTKKRGYYQRAALIRGNTVDVVAKSIQQIELVRQLKNPDHAVVANECIYACLNNFRKNQRNENKIFSRKCNSIIKDGKISRTES